MVCDRWRRWGAWRGLGRVLSAAGGVMLAGGAGEQRASSSCKLVDAHLRPLYAHAPAPERGRLSPASRGVAGGRAIWLLPADAGRGRSRKRASGTGWRCFVTEIVSPYLLFSGLVVAAIGVAIAIPRRRVNPQASGAVVAGGGLGLVLLSLAVSNPDAIPNLHFYVFGVIALGSSLRVVTHPRPVYAALFFILTILSSCGLYVILAAEFLAFALIIIYAGAILITYLFVIMLATQAPSEDRIEVLAEYDVSGREPIFAVPASFVLLGSLTALLFTGSAQLQPEAGPGEELQRQIAVMDRMPGKAERILRETDVIGADDTVVGVDAPLGSARAQAEGEGGAETLRTVALPEAAMPTNVEMVGFDLLAEHPGTIEIAGIILLMAMVGATVLARRQSELEDEAKRRAAEALAARGGLTAQPVVADVSAGQQREDA